MVLLVLGLLLRLQGRQGRKLSSRKPLPGSSLEAGTSRINLENWGEKNLLICIRMENVKMSRILYTFPYQPILEGTKRYINRVGKLTVL